MMSEEQLRLQAPRIEASGLSFSTPDRRRVLASGISFCLRSGQVLVVSGPNGSGKSTLLKLILGKTLAQTGSFALHVPPSSIGYLPQLHHPRFHLPMTLRDVLEISTQENASERNFEEKVERIGLLEKRHLELAWNTASGGERKRTLLTRILLNPPSLLLLDEPLNHLDEDSRLRVLRAIRAYATDSAKPGAVVLVSHDTAVESELSQISPLRLHLGSPLGEEVRK